MVHPGMVGIAELMTDDSFAVWVEEQPEDQLGSLSTFEVYSRYCQEREEEIN